MASRRKSSAVPLVRLVARWLSPLLQKRQAKRLSIHALKTLSNLGQNRFRRPVCTPPEVHAAKTGNTNAPCRDHVWTWRIHRNECRNNVLWTPHVQNAASLTSVTSHEWIR